MSLNNNFKKMLGIGGSSKSSDIPDRRHDDPTYHNVIQGEETNHGDPYVVLAKGEGKNHPLPKPLN